MLYAVKEKQYIAASKFKKYDAANETVQQFNIQPYRGFGIGYCQVCQKPITEHGVLNGQLICPNSYIIYKEGNITSVMSAENFEKIYEPLVEEE